MTSCACAATLPALVQCSTDCCLMCFVECVDERVLYSSDFSLAAFYRYQLDFYLKMSDYTSFVLGMFFSFAQSQAGIVG